MPKSRAPRIACRYLIRIALDKTGVDWPSEPGSPEPLDTFHQRLKSEIHMHLVMTMEQGWTRIVIYEIDLDVWLGLTCTTSFTNPKVGFPAILIISTL